MAHRGLQARMAVAMSVLFGFYVIVAALFAPVVGIPVVLAGSLVFVGVQYVVGKKLALYSVGATDLPADDRPEVHRRVETLADDMGIEKPRLMVGQMGLPNAFAVGRKGAGTVVVSETMLALVDEGHMSMDELEGVLAHELAHVKNRDVVVMLLGQSVASIVGLTVFFVVQLVMDDIPIVGFVVAYLLSLLTQMLVMVFVLAISRYRGMSPTRTPPHTPATRRRSRTPWRSSRRSAPTSRPPRWTAPPPRCASSAASAGWRRRFSPPIHPRTSGSGA